MFVFAAVVFRSEVALLLATTVLHLAVVPALSLERAVFPFAVSFVAALVISVPIDSYFWQRPLWPELWAFHYNVVRGGASAWGVSPWHYYFTSALPRLLLNPVAYGVLLPLALWHPALRRAAARLAAGPLLFVALYSLQPHKETRFVFYAVPPLTAAAALAANLLFARGRKGPLAALAAALLVASVLAAFAASSAMLALSSLNYPGGEALAHLRDTVIARSPDALPQGSDKHADRDAAVVPVHADVLACMTGVTLFGSSVNISVGRSVAMAVDKTEDEAMLARADFWRQFAYVLAERPDGVRRAAAGAAGDVAWETVGVVKGFGGGIEVVRPGEEGDESEGGEDGTAAAVAAAVPVVGRGRMVDLLKKRVRALTGGWWVGPRMVEKIYILKKVKGTGSRGVAAGSG